MFKWQKLIFPIALAVFLGVYLLYFCKKSNWKWPILEITNQQVIQKGKKVLSYSLFGSFDKYGDHIIRIADESNKSELFGKEGWQVRIYTDLDVPVEFEKKIKALNPRLLFIKINNKERTYNAMIWRFFPMNETDLDVSCFRDLDSPIIRRGEMAVREYLASKFFFHGMRDYPDHTSKIMGGLWCIKNKQEPRFAKKLLELVVKNAQKRSPGVKEASRGNDQGVLNRYVWPLVLNNSMTHDSFYCNWAPGGVPFPTQKNFPDMRFVGCYYPCNKVDYTKLLACPEKCRPKQHKDWKYC